MHTFKAAQPALLYLSPACVLSVIFVAIFKGDLKNIISYTSGPNEEKKAKLVEEQPPAPNNS